MLSKRHLLDSSDPLSPDPTINKNKKLFITRNRYEPLQAESQITQNSTTDTQKFTSEIPNYVNPIKPPPPIFVKGMVNFPDLCAALIEKIGVDNFYCKSSTDSLKIQTANPDAYRILVHSLRDQNAQFHTYQLREDKPTRVVLRNLHNSVTPSKTYAQATSNQPSQSSPPTPPTDLTATISSFVDELNLIKSNHPDGTAHGGAAILIKSNLQYYSLVNYSQNHFQSCAISITINNIPVAIAAIYSPPRHNLTIENLTDFFDSTANNFIIGGDYNAKHQSWGCRVTNPRGNLLYNISNMKKYKILAPPGPTYWPTSVRKKPDILDIFVTKIPSNLYYSINNILDLNSDHLSVILNIDATPQIRTVSPKLFTVTTDRLKFHNIIAEEINLKISLKSAHEIDDAVNNLTTLIQSTASKSNPQNTTNNSVHKYPFVSEQVRSLIVEKRRARARYQITRLPSHKSAYNKLANSLKKCLAKNKADMYEHKMTSLSSVEGSLWHETKKLLQYKSPSVPLKKPDNSFAFSDNDKAEVFKAHLHETFQPHHDILTPENIDEVNTYLNLPSTLNQPEKYFTPNEVKQTIQKYSLQKVTQL
ncbi:hypothetical protein QTP88_026821 [Uroleucon formosanum]